MELDVRYARTTDGVNVAYATVGSGPTVIFPPGWISHLQLFWDGATYYRMFGEMIAETHRLVLYDNRGCGLSDRDIKDVSADTLMLDLDAVVEAIDADRFALFAVSWAGPMAVRYAVENPERVTRLGFYGSYPAHRAVDPEMLAVLRASWGVASREFYSRLTPDGDFTQEMLEAGAKRLREAATADVGLAYQGMVDDQRPQLSRVRAPTLVVHRRGDEAVPVAGGRELAAGIPDARFVLLEGRNHVPVASDASEAANTMAPILTFLAEDLPTGYAAGGFEEGFQTILFTDLEASTPLTQRLGDEGAQELLRGHNTTVRAALDEYGGREVKHTGDGIMASFPSAVSAVTAALQIQRGLAGGEVRVRVGLNAGEPIVDNDDLFGLSVIKAARIADRAEPGTVLVSHVVKQLCEGKTFEFASLGAVSLKGLDEAVELFEVRG